VYQAPGSNALEVAKGIYGTMDRLKGSFPKDVDYVVPFESVSVVKVSISEVVVTLLEALGLVVLVVFLFLQSWRATIIRSSRSRSPSSARSRSSSLSALRSIR
jgi:HAE1 family hydrophobic/amphiphilic exporter-1